MAKKYYLFLDECGDQNLANFDPSFPIFTLCGIILSEAQLQMLATQIDDLKKEFWGDRKIILHSRDIRKCQNGFEILFNLETKQAFYERINHHHLHPCSLKSQNRVLCLPSNSVVQ